MRVFSILLIISMLFISYPVYALNLDSSTLIDNIIKSLDEERDHWIIRSNEAFYMKDIPTYKVRITSWPDMEPGCLIDFSHYVMRGKRSFIMFDKPKNFQETISKDEENKLGQKMRQVLYEELHNRYRIRMPKPKPKVVIKPPEKGHGIAVVKPFGKL